MNRAAAFIIGCLGLLFAGCHDNDDHAQASQTSVSASFPPSNTGVTSSTITTPTATPSSVQGIWTGFVSPGCFPTTQSANASVATCSCCPTNPLVGMACQVGPCVSLVVRGTN